MADFERQKRVIGIMITAHSVLRDHYYRLSLIVENCLLIASVILNALVFIDTAYITKIFGISEDLQKLIIGISSIAVFSISVILLQVRWKEKAENHSKAAEQLSNLMHEIRTIFGLPDGNPKDLIIAEFDKKYAEVNTRIVKIPDAKFNSLKLKHYRKVELSKLIEKHPGSIIFILKLKLFISSFNK